MRHAQITKWLRNRSPNTEKIGFYLWHSGSLLSGFWFNFHYWECLAHQMILIISPGRKIISTKRTFITLPDTQTSLSMTVSVMSVTLIKTEIPVFGHWWYVGKYFWIFTITLMDTQVHSICQIFRCSAAKYVGLFVTLGTIAQKASCPLLFPCIYKIHCLLTF